MIGGENPLHFIIPFPQSVLHRELWTTLITALTSDCGGNHLFILWSYYCYRLCVGPQARLGMAASVGSNPGLVTFPIFISATPFISSGATDTGPHPGRPGGRDGATGTVLRLTEYYHIIIIINVRYVSLHSHKTLCITYMQYAI